MFEVKKELLDTHEALLEVVFEDETVEEAKRRAARSISREVSIPGFRRGRAPYAKVAQYVGEPTILQEAAEQLLDSTYSDIIEEADVEPYGPGEFVEMETEPLRFKIRVPLQPNVELGDYESLREEWEAPDVSDEEMEQVLQQIREENAVLEPVDRPAALGDEVVIDVHATSGGEVIVDEHDIEVVLDQDRPFLSAEFVETLVGMSVGEEKTVILTLPETIEEPTLRGVDAEFHLEMSQVYERSLPDVDDALASTVGSFETVDELKEDIRERILSSKQEQTESAYRNKLIEQLLEQADIVYPPQMVEDTLDDIVEETRQQVQRQQQMSLDDALRLEGRTMEQFREQMRPQAERRVERSLVLAEFAREENVEASDDEVVRAFGELFESMGMPAEAVQGRELDIKSDLGQSLRSSVLGRKVMERLAAIGRGEAGEITEVEAEAEAPEVEVNEEEGDMDEEKRTADIEPESGWPSTAGAPPEDKEEEESPESPVQPSDKPAEIGGEPEEEA